MDFAQLPPRTAMLTFGPTAGWGNEFSHGVAGNQGPV